MSNYIFRLDTRRCINCKACEVHCKSSKFLPPGAKLGVLITVRPTQVAKGRRIISAFAPCFHCAKPWCVSVCPTGAMIRREKDGIVYVNKELCVGCKSCIVVCPWHFPQVDETSGKIVKCDYCMDRVDAGLKPACVAACSVHALSFGKPNEDAAKIRDSFGKSTMVNKDWGIRPND
jgi:Fe-S-cluster-containing dehydrogenase component